MRWVWLAWAMGAGCGARVAWIRAVDAAAPFDGVTLPPGAVRGPGAVVDGVPGGDACRPRARLHLAVPVDAVVVAARAPAPVCVRFGTDRGGGWRCEPVADGLAAITSDRPAEVVEVLGRCVQEVTPWWRVEDP